MTESHYVAQVGVEHMVLLSFTIYCGENDSEPTLKAGTGNAFLVIPTSGCEVFPPLFHNAPCDVGRGV